MIEPHQVHKSNLKRRKISTIHGQGFKKSILEVNVISPAGKRRTVAWSEDPHPGLDKRLRKPNPFWVTLVSWKDESLSLSLRMHRISRQLSFRIWGHAHRAYFPLSWEDSSALYESILLTHVKYPRNMSLAIRSNLERKLKRPPGLEKIGRWKKLKGS